MLVTAELPTLVGLVSFQMEEGGENQDYTQAGKRLASEGVNVMRMMMKNTDQD